MECSVASAFGWSLDQIYDDLDLPTYKRISEWWVDNPPLWMLGRLLLNVGEQTGVIAKRTPRSRDPRLAVPDGPVPTKPVAANPDAFMQDFVQHLGGHVQRVGPNYFEELCRELDRGRAQYWLARSQDVNVDGEGRAG